MPTFKVALLAGAVFAANPSDRPKQIDDIKDPNKTYVHLITHSHDDVGWLKTPFEYYSGTNSIMKKASVERILDNVVVELHKDPTRTFTEVEMWFFSTWYVR